MKQSIVGVLLFLFIGSSWAADVTAPQEAGTVLAGPIKNPPDGVVAPDVPTYKPINDLMIEKFFIKSTASGTLYPVLTPTSGNVALTYSPSDFYFECSTRELFAAMFVGSGAKLTGVQAEGLKTTAAPVATVTATPPAAGQVLTATSPTTAAWKTPEPVTAVSYDANIYANTRHNLKLHFGPLPVVCFVKNAEA